MHYVEAGGKRLRAVLPSLVGEAAGKHNGGHYDLGAAIEMPLEKSRQGRMEEREAAEPRSETEAEESSVVWTREAPVVEEVEFLAG